LRSMASSTTSLAARAAGAAAASSAIALELFAGLRSFGEGFSTALLALFRSLYEPALEGRKKLYTKLWWTPVALCIVYGIALACVLVTGPFFFVLRAVEAMVSAVIGVMSPDSGPSDSSFQQPALHVFLEFGVMVYLVLLRQYFPQFLDHVGLFFDILEKRDPTYARELREKPILSDVGSLIKKWIRFSVWGVVLVCLGCMGAIFLIALVVALAAVTGPLVLVAIAGGALLLGGLAFGGFSVLKPFLKLFNFDPILGLLVVLCLIAGLVSFSNVVWFTKTATQLYFSTQIVTKQLLADFKDRQGDDSWQDFKSAARYRMTGFGLPMYLLSQFVSPVVVILFLQIFEGAASDLVWRMKILEKEE